MTAKNQSTAHPSTASTIAGGELGAKLAELRDRWGWFVGFGVLLIVCGAIALGSIVLATVVTVLWVGAMMIVSGVFEIIHAIRMKSWGRALLWGAIGLLYIAAGILTAVNPILGSVVLTLLLGAGLIAAGGVRLVLAFRMRDSSGSWGWVLVSGIVTLALGVIILLGWPFSSLYALGIFLGVDLVFAGAGWVAFGIALRNRRTDTPASQPQSMARSS